MRGRIKGLAIGIVGFVLGAVSTPLIHGQGGTLDGTFAHVGFAVRDVDKSAKEFSDLFGVDVPAPLVLHDVPYLPRDGGKFKTMNVKVIGLTVGGMRFELLQGIDGDSLWNDYIATHGEGFHHIAIGVPGVARTRDMLLAKGGKLTLETTTASYVDLQPKSFPLTVEINAAQPPRAGGAK